MATDGLFDNLDLDEIVKEISDWEKTWFTSQSKDLRYSSVNSDAAMKALAKLIVLKARELSLDKERDSPFAILAKENDVMWGGGMPDDTSVVVARVTTSAPIMSTS
jgi:protein phosphatase PTC7